MNTYYIDIILTTLTYLAASFILFLIGRFVYKLFHRNIKINEELVEKDNLAFSFAYTGYFVGLLIAIGSVMMGESQGLMLDMRDIAIYGILAILLLNISIIINDKVVFRKFSIKKEICEDQNAGTGIIEGANSIATGMIILGSVYGEGNIYTLFGYWIIGQLLLILTSFIYSKIVPFDIHEQIEKDNVAVGVGAAGAMVAIGNLVRHAMMHDFDSWYDTLITIGMDAGIGLFFLPLARYFADKILLPGQNLTDELVNQEKPNIGASVVEAFAYVGGSVLLTWSL